MGRVGTDARSEEVRARCCCISQSGLDRFRQRLGGDVDVDINIDGWSGSAYLFVGEGDAMPIHVDRVRKRSAGIEWSAAEGG